MKLSQAIENVEEEVKFEQEEHNLTMVDSLSILIEAGKELKRLRPLLPLPNRRLLPGETEE